MGKTMRSAEEEEWERGRRRIAEIVEAFGIEAVQVRPLPYVINVVAQRLDMGDTEMGEWIDSVLARLDDIGVKTLRHFVTNVVRLNNMLTERGHDGLDEPTLVMMLEEA